MSNETAIDILKDIHFTAYCMEQSIDTSKAIEKACDALKKLDIIEKIISSNNIDRYQVIVDLLYGVGGPDGTTNGD